MSRKIVKGEIVHWGRDEYGELAVADNDGVRSLYFGDVLQTSIRLDRPEDLVEEYSRAIMSPFVFRNDARKALLVGLGGGSLVHFLLRAFPDCLVHVVELRRQVIEIARDFFFLLSEGPNLEIFHAAGEEFLSEKADSEHYDLIFVDAFDDDGPAGSLLEKDFLALCRGRLSESGIFAMNLWCRPKDNFPAVYESLKQAFGENTLKLQPGEAYWNTIVFGSNDGQLFLDLPSYRETARQLRRKCGVDFPKYLKLLYWQNFR